MSTQLDLKEIELKAFKSTYQDGLWDILYGLMVVGMSLFLYHPAEGYGPKNIILMVVMFGVFYGLFVAGKIFITLPRMGQVRFGAVRKQKNRTLAIVLGVFVLIQVGMVGLTALGWLNPEASTKLNDFLNQPGSHLSGLLVVAAIASLMFGTSFIVIAFFTDFLRGYYIAILMALAVFLMIYLNQRAYALIIGGLILVPGLFLLVRFLKTYPLQRKDAPLEEE
jgi:hypothetical protein